MRSQNDVAFHLRMAALVILSMFGEQLATSHLPNWSSPRIGVITFVLGMLWVGLFAWQHGNALHDRIRVLEGKLDALGARTDNLEEDRRARRSLPPM